jgi:hypothetical protein
MGERKMILLSSLIKQFKSNFINRYQNSLLPSHLKAMNAMEICRTNESPCLLVQCDDCGHERYLHHSCGHRSCPHCQNHESQQWIENQLKRQVPATYFMITFTLPAEFRPLVWHHQRKMYQLMFECVWETIQTFSKNDTQLRGKAGGIAVLHTHSRALDFHPHIHFVMPALVVDMLKKEWRKKEGKFLFSHKALANVFRAKMLAGIQREQLLTPEKHPLKWVVDCRSVGGGDKALVYLGRYLYRGVIQEKDIIRCVNGYVTFRYQDSNTKKQVEKTVTGERFLWLILQHIPPARFRRARNYGFLHPNSKKIIQVLHFLLKWNPSHLLKNIKKRPTIHCPACNGKMSIILTRIPTTTIMIRII